jgi:uncharacterized membrane protein
MRLQYRGKWRALFRTEPTLGAHHIWWHAPPRIAESGRQQFSSAEFSMILHMAWRMHIWTVDVQPIGGDPPGLKPRFWSTTFYGRGIGMKSLLLLSTAIGGVLALGALNMNAHAADDPNTEKCYGINKAGKNDCAGASHACAGQSKEAGSMKEFIKVPKGTCERIVGGSLTSK